MFVTQNFCDNIVLTNTRLNGNLWECPENFKCFVLYYLNLVWGK